MITSKTFNVILLKQTKKKSFAKYLSREGSESSLESFPIYFLTFYLLQNYLIYTLFLNLVNQ